MEIGVIKTPVSGESSFGCSLDIMRIRCEQRVRDEAFF